MKLAVDIALASALVLAIALALSGNALGAVIIAATLATAVLLRLV